MAPDSVLLLHQQRKLSSHCGTCAPAADEQVTTKVVAEARKPRSTKRSGRLESQPMWRLATCMAPVPSALLHRNWSRAATRSKSWSAASATELMPRVRRGPTCPPERPDSRTRVEREAGAALAGIVESSSGRGPELVRGC